MCPIKYVCYTLFYQLRLTVRQVPELISQRRRWLNGSFFASIHGTVKFHYIYRSSHTFLRKFWIHIEFIYQTFNLLFSWFALVSASFRPSEPTLTHIVRRATSTSSSSS